MKKLNKIEELQKKQKELQKEQEKINEKIAEFDLEISENLRKQKLEEEKEQKEAEKKEFIERNFGYLINSELTNVDIKDFWVEDCYEDGKIQRGNKIEFTFSNGKKLILESTFYDYEDADIEIKKY